MKTIIPAILVLVFAVALSMPGTTQASRGVNTVVAQTTGVNPDDYPCAKAGIVALYENREKISNLSALHPKRVFTWTLETLTYYSIKFIHFIKGLFTVDAVKSGVRNVANIARSGDPLGSVSHKVDGWVSGLNPRSRFVMRRKVEKLIEDSTNEDGSCKL